VAQRVRWDRGEPAQPVVQRVRWQPGRQPPTPAGIELSPPPTRSGSAGTNLYGTNPYGTNPYGTNPARVDSVRIDLDLPPAYPTVNRAPDTPVVPVQRFESAETSPASSVVQRVEAAGVPVIVQSAPEPPAAPDPIAPTDPAAPTAPTAPAAATGGAPPSGPAAGAAADPEELLKKLFDPLLRRLKTELRLDRERYGALTDRA
jgi:hypothetical protein